jgi:hypothetical protein
MSPKQQLQIEAEISSGKIISKQNRKVTETFQSVPGKTIKIS